MDDINYLDEFAFDQKLLLFRLRLSCCSLSIKADYPLQLVLSRKQINYLPELVLWVATIRFYSVEDLSPSDRLI